MAEQLKTYRGNCHCGAYVYEVKLSQDAKPSECNCSSCYRKGGLWMGPTKENLHFVKGDPETLTNYTFGGKTWNHKFCPTCGVQVMIVGHIVAPQPGEEKEPIVGINARTFQYGQGLDVWKVETKFMDGKAYGTPYEPVQFTGPEPKAAIEGGKLYTGSCHCGAVKLALKSKPLDKTFTERVVECNCSICNRLGAVWLYPKKDQVEVEGEEHLATYLFNTKLSGKAFCKICGVTVYNAMQPVTDELLSKIPEKDRASLGRNDMLPINLRVIDNLNIRDLNIERADGYNVIKPIYVEP
ncbi:glutathione-dependent formaldehyde-activating enzyme [Hypoxylon sp. NC1633]|nr:glutathione-dependent formaldehyde-activating enzyme [Hypoxylon sp. NC1633]